MKQAKYSALIFGLLMLAIACGSPVSNSAVPALSEKKEVVPTPQNSDEVDEFDRYCHKTIEKDFAQISVKNTAPAIITNIVSVNGKKDFKEGIDIEIKNVSDKPIGSMFVDISPQPNCSEYLYIAKPMVEVKDKERSEIKPGESVVTHISPKDSTDYFRIVKCRDTMPNASPKQFVSVSWVKFSDSSEWHAGNGCLEDTVKP